MRRPLCKYHIIKSALRQKKCLHAYIYSTKDIIWQATEAGPYNDAPNSEGPIQLNPSLCHMPRVTHAIGGVMYLS